MFWSLLLEPGKRYTKVVDSSFHISAAVLDIVASDNGVVRVIVDIGDTEAHIANLSLKHGILQTPLDLQFEAGSRVSFYTTGAKTNVHLSGYMVYDDVLPSDEEDSDEDASDKEVPTLVNPSTKRKPEDTLPTENKKAKVQKVVSPNDKKAAPPPPAAAAASGVKPSSPTKPQENDQLNKLEMEDTSEGEEDDVDEDGLEDSEEGEEEEEEDEGEEEDDIGEEEEEDDYDEDDDDDNDEEDDSDIEDEDEEDTMNAVKDNKGGKQQQFPSKEPVKVFNFKNTDGTKTPGKANAKNSPKGAMTPGADTAKTPKGGKIPGGDSGKTPKGQKTPGGENAKTPKGQKTPGGENAKTPKGQKTQDGDNVKTPGGEGKPKISPGKQQMSPKQNGKIPKTETPGKNAEKSPQSQKVVKPGGVVCEDLTVGSGPEAKNGKMVCVYYEGRLARNNKLFDKCDTGKGFKFRLGGGEVIKGWDVGVSGMKIGGKRKITCPAHMAYGKKGAPPDIPGNSVLSFVVELKGIS